ncbi:hypothetical protein PSACC_02968 [Paramicrosporidium saccamoebae]|uniref:BHLH domain-containing protein n=1 Tax=Paramicrosporidium saccamoebae TaxID=1246581 RepID=A0A2H9THM5_9FUNG|nr:hypothetical protein PSACC_02968 [Paramicrosporidium saccamoebae]
MEFLQGYAARQPRIKTQKSLVGCCRSATHTIMSPASKALSVQSLLNPEMPPVSGSQQRAQYHVVPQSQTLPRIELMMLNKSACRVPASQVYLTKGPGGQSYMVRYPDARACMPTKYVTPVYIPRLKMPMPPTPAPIRPMRPIVSAPTTPVSSLSPSSSQSTILEENCSQNPYARSPRLKHLHKLAERKRRSHLRVVFDELRDILTESNGQVPGSKSDIVDAAVVTIDLLKEKCSELQRTKATLLQ